MKITGINSAYSRAKFSPNFKAGATDFYADFDGTYLPSQYNHDVICQDGFLKRNEFLKNGKKSFQDYFDSFKQFMDTAKGANGDKFEFTITTGRNRAEYNYFMQRLKKDGLSVVIPDRLIVNNGQDIYFPRKNMQDFFSSAFDEPFLAQDFSREKRDLVKKTSNGWDGARIREIIQNMLLAQKNTSLDKKQKKSPKITIFNADTDGFFYGENMSYWDKLKTFDVPPDTFAAIREDGDLSFHINFSPNLSANDELMKEISGLITSEITKDGTDVYSKLYNPNEFDSAALKLVPEIDGQKINKFFDTKLSVDKIIADNLNDLVVVAGDSSNDLRMLNLFEYITSENGTNFTKESLEQIYKLPVISIFVNNNSKKTKSLSFDNGILLDKIDNYFNSDGNVRFIVVDALNPAKPQTLQDALKVAIKEYAKRNKEFQANLPDDMKKLIENFDYNYPINRKISRKLEKQTGAKLWTPFCELKSVKKTILTKILPITISAGALFGISAYFYKKSKIKEQKNIQNLVIAQNVHNDMAKQDMFKKFHSI